MTRMLNHTTMDHRRAFLAYSFGFAVAFAILLARLAYFQLWSGEAFRSLSETNRIRVTEIHAPRGRILDANQEILVDNRPCFDVTVIPEEVQDYASIETSLSRLCPFPAEALKEKLAATRRSVPFRSHVLWRDASWETVAYLEANALRIPGVMIQVAQARDYLTSGLFAHAIGYIGEISQRDLDASQTHKYRIGDWIGKAGIERNWEGQLRGRKGGLQVEADARGRQISVIKRKEPVPGRTLFLTLERRLQERALQAFGDRHGVAIAADPRDGRILCYLSLPSFDPNRFVGGISREDWDSLRLDPYHPLTDRAIQGLYPLGSVFKIVLAVAALEEGVITPQDRIFCSGKHRLGVREFRCWRKSGHGSVDLHRALVESCDVYFYQVGLRLGIERIHEYATRFGFGRSTGIGLDGEKTGLVPSPEWKRKRFGEPWYEGETLVVSIGQGALLVTPLQVVRMLSALANGGTLVTPRLVERIESADGRPFNEGSTAPAASIRLSKGTADIVRQALRDVVESDRGTGKRARIKGVEVAGKTGTAQVVRMGDRAPKKSDTPHRERDHAWFACHAPAASPEIVVVVMVEHGGHGGESAAPVAREILDEYFRPDPQAEIQAASPPKDSGG